MFSIAPVDKSSITNTSCDADNSASERCDPMNPAPPVISTRMVFLCSPKSLSMLAGRCGHCISLAGSYPPFATQEPVLSPSLVGCRRLPVLAAPGMPDYSPGPAQTVPTAGISGMGLRALVGGKKSPGHTVA